MMTAPIRSAPLALLIAAGAASADARAASFEQAKAQCHERFVPIVRECVHRKVAQSGGSPSQYIPGCRAAIMPQARACVAGLMGVGKTRAPSSAAEPVEIVIKPPAGPGRVVMLISGNDGPEPYRDFGEQVAKLGYYTVIIDGRAILSGDMQGGGRLQKAIERAQSSADAKPGKIAVIGFSQGGGGALAYAERQPETVATVVAYYPLTAFIAKVTDMKTFVGKFQVPLVVFAGGKDDYKKCCLLRTIRSMEEAAKQLDRPMELVVYPDAGHNFIKGANYRADDAGDAWRRTNETLHRYLDDAPAH